MVNPPSSSTDATAAEPTNTAAADAKIPQAANKSPRRLVRILAWLLAACVAASLIAVLAAAFAWRYYQSWLVTPLNLNSESIDFQVVQGDSLGSVGRRLNDAGALTHPELLRLYARLESATRIQRGDYRLAAGITPQQLITKLVEGDVISFQVTFIEGWTLKQFLQALGKVADIEHTLTNPTPEAIAEALSIKGHPEGWLYPDTYTFHRGTRDIDILRQAHQRMQTVLNEAWETRAKELPYKNAYEALIMASIIERETGHASERPDIAGVFVRRLQIGMKLQTDPTVIYGMGERYRGKITRADLQAPSAHNTYVISGLPPTPISNPSRAAIEAALNPASGKALYFVAKGDGTSHFSATLAEHNQAVRRYQINRRADYRAAPPASVAPSSVGATSRDSPGKSPSSSSAVSSSVSSDRATARP